MSRQYLCMKEIVVTDLQQGLSGNKCGSDNFIRGLSQATQQLYGDLSLSTALVSLFFPSFPLPVLYPGGSVVKKKKICLPMLEAQVQCLGGEDSLQEETTSHCSILAWKSPWTEEPAGLESMELQSQTRLRDSTTVLSPPQSLSFPSHPLQAKTSAGAGAPGRNFTMRSSDSTGVC